jgi:hypothetical protein
MLERYIPVGDEINMAWLAFHKHSVQRTLRIGFTIMTVRFSICLMLRCVDLDHIRKPSIWGTTASRRYDHGWTPTERTAQEMCRESLIHEQLNISMEQLIVTEAVNGRIAQTLVAHRELVHLTKGSSGK